MSFYNGFPGNRSCGVLMIIAIAVEITDLTLTYLAEDLSRTCQGKTVGMSRSLVWKEHRGDAKHNSGVSELTAS